MTARLFLLTNDLPKFSDKSGGIWDRLRIVAFNEVIRGTSKQDKDLRTKLKKELPGIFNWALEGLYKLWKHEHFPESDISVKIKEQYRLRCNPIQEHLIDTYEVGDRSDDIETQDAFKEYMNHCDQTNTRPVSQVNFVDAVLKQFRGCQKKRKALDGKKLRYFVGLKRRM